MRLAISELYPISHSLPDIAHVLIKLSLLTVYASLSYCQN